ncbi:hypothetical protein [Leisingera caerulea]|uniref:hypothetical protein n=1 Tax=Leisingera caerulea TaxID=506591 RepID=UPI0021A7E4F1|nr:hypothetical protein [Leisingera caerulea]UWQ83123.1 hypothetical protein K3726_15880 [Leisingera caerulea]
MASQSTYYPVGYGCLETLECDKLHLMVVSLISLILVLAIWAIPQVTYKSKHYAVLWSGFLFAFFGNVIYAHHWIVAPTSQALKMNPSSGEFTIIFCWLFVWLAIISMIVGLALRHKEPKLSLGWLVTLSLVLFPFGVSLAVLLGYFTSQSYDYYAVAGFLFST